MLPLILGAIALGSAAFGTATGVSGVMDINEAQAKGKKAEAHYNRTKRELEERWDYVNDLAKEYGELQLSILQNTVGRFVRFIEKTGRQASMGDKEFLEGLDVSVQQMHEYRNAALQAEKFFKGGFSAAGAAAAGYGGAMTVATTIGVASTGTAISSLSGAAATNAILAFFGGGSLAAGGGGMALGSMILGGITIGPAIAIGGFVLGSEGEKALTKAREYEAKVNLAVGEMESAKAFADQVERRICELWELLESFNEQAIAGLDKLESRRCFRRRRDAKLFQQVAMLIKAIAEITQTPILDAEGELTPESLSIQVKYGKYKGKAA